MPNPLFSALLPYYPHLMQASTVAVWLTATLVGIELFRTFLAAEQGRRHDFVKRTPYLAHQADTALFDIILLIPYHSLHQHRPLLDTLACVLQQDYPQQRLRCLILTPPSLAEEQTLLEGHFTDHPQLEWWQAPATGYTYTAEALMMWACEALHGLASDTLISVLQPGDLIQTDYTQQVAVRGYDAPCFQGYLGARCLSQGGESPTGLLAQYLAWHTRLYSRTLLAGFAHSDASVPLQPSGCTFAAYLLEQHQYRLPLHDGWLALTATFTQQGYAPAWAPNVVVIQRPQPELTQHVRQHLASGWQRWCWSSTHLLPYLFSGKAALVRLAVHGFYLPLPWWVFACFVLCKLSEQPWFFGLPSVVAASTWSQLALGLACLHAMSLLVARLRWHEWGVACGVSSLVMLLQLCVFPWALVKAVFERVNRPFSDAASASSIRGIEGRPSSLSQRLQETSPQPSSRFNEALPSVASHPESPLLQQKSFEASLTNSREALLASNPSLRQFLDQAEHESHVEAHLHQQQRSNLAQFELHSPTPLALLFGEKKLMAEASIDFEHDPERGLLYRLRLQFKQQAFETNAYPLLDSAFYELQAILQPYGIRLHSCGGCAYFYHPPLSTNEAVGSQSQAGVCLFTKQGQPVDWQQDTPISVLSPSCSAYTLIEEREQVHRRWRESL
ncbi:MAG: hypothetical protein ACKO34_03565 [Vampirovibrionales bacterium]